MGNGRYNELPHNNRLHRIEYFPPKTGHRELTKEEVLVEMKENLGKWTKKTGRLFIQKGTV
jgi:hypothetical protein